MNNKNNQHQTTWKTVLVEYSVHIGSFIYGSSLGSIMSLVGKYLGTIGMHTTGLLGRYLLW